MQIDHSQKSSRSGDLLLSIPLLMILLLRLLAAGWFAANTPLWEKSDEINHYLYAHVLAFEHRLPDERDTATVPEVARIYLQYDQPPLYYLMLAPIVRIFDSPTLYTPISNPVPVCDSPFMHYYIHPHAWNATTRSAWVGRMFSVLMGVAATYVIYLAGRRMFSARVALLAAAIFALMPATVELSTWMNNDTPLMLFGSLFVYGLARSSFKWMIAAAVLCLATKLNGLAVLPVLVTAFLWLRQSQNRLSLQRRILPLLVVLLIGFFAFNVVRCGAAVCRIHRSTLAFDSPASFLDTLHGDFYGDAIWHFTRSAAVPWINSLYQPQGWMLILGWSIFVVGILSAFYRRDKYVILLGLLLVSALGLGLLRVWWLQVGYMPVRYAAVALPGLALLLAVGYESLSQRFLIWIPVLGFGVLAMLSPLLNYHPLFEPVPREDTLPQTVTRFDDFRFASGMQMGGYTLQPDSVTLYMGTTQPIHDPLFVMVAALNESGHIIESCGMTAGGAFWSTLDWQPGEWVVQTFPLNTLSQASQVDIRVYYLLNSSHLYNLYDVEHPDDLIQGERIRVQFSPR